MRIRIKNPFLFLLVIAGLGLKLAGQAPAQTNHAAIPFNQIGAEARENYAGNGLSIVQTAEGAFLRCVFQKLEGRVNCQGLWLTSTAGPSNSAPFRVVARSVGREHCMTLPLASTGDVGALSKSARFHRGGLDEEYTVSMDGIRQDLIVTSRPDGNGALRVNLVVDGASAEALRDGVRLVLDASGRKLVYNHLKVTDAHGRELTARMEVVSPGNLAVVVDDAASAYPVRIDPTFSDANWASLGTVGLPGANGAISATVVDTNGNVYVGGNFTIIGSVIATNIAKWNGSAWSPVGSGIGQVNSLALDRFGNLYAGGEFVSAGSIAKWNGSTWSPLGSGINGYVYGLACDSSGNLYAGGYFRTAGGVSATNIAKWNGTNWFALGSGMNNFVFALACDSSGNLYAGGDFTTAGGAPALYIAKWNGNAWSALGSGFVSGASGEVIYSLACDSSGNLYAGGYFRTAGGVSATNIAKWNGTNWFALGSGVNGYVYALASDSAGNLYAGGGFSIAGGVSATNIAKWNGSTWSSLGSGLNGSVSSLALDSSGNLFTDGGYSYLDALIANNISKWNGTNWSALGSGLAPGVIGQVNALACDSSGNLYVESVNGGGDASVIAEWNGSAWSPLSSTDFSVYALACDSSGNLYAGGAFSTVGGVLARNISEWNGSAWSPLGSGINGEVYALAFDTEGNLYAGGYFTTAGGVGATNIAKWNGSSWSALGSGVGSEVESGCDYDQVLCLACDQSGNLYAGGFFSTAGGVATTNIAKWNGSSWSTLGSGVGSFTNCDHIFSLVCDTAGNLYAGGEFATVGGISGVAKWNGNTWSELGSGINGPVLSLAFDTDGNLFAGGAFSGADRVSANRIAMWNGSIWSALGSGMSESDSVGYTDHGANEFGPTVNALALDGFGSLYAGGNFYTAGTNVAFYIAEALLTGTSTRPKPPTVAIQPTNGLVTVPAGAYVTFSVSVAGIGPFSYQWQLNGTNLPNGIITTAAGIGTQGCCGDGGAATNAGLSWPSGVAVDATGNVFIADIDNNSIRKVGTNGIIIIAAGNGTSGYSGDGGAATNAELSGPSAVAVDATGNLFIADTDNNRIRKVSTNGIIITAAGNGTSGYSGDGGAATNAELSGPSAVTVDVTGNLFIADQSNSRIRKVSTNGIIVTVAGNGTSGYSGDGGAATYAEFNNPSGVAVDATGNLFIADQSNSRIRKVGTNGIIVTVAGNGTYGYSGDGGAATYAEFSNPSGVAVDATGNLFIADQFNNRIRKVSTNGIIVTAAGNGTFGYLGDGGVATYAEFRNPSGVAVDATGNLFIADTHNNRIRKVVFNSSILSPTLVFNDVGFGNAGAYDVVVSSAYGSVTSSVVTLTVSSGPNMSSNLVLNGGFETGDFTDWSGSGNFTDSLIANASTYVHSGSYGAKLGPSGSLGYLSQTIPTTAGASYLLSFWLYSPNGETPNEFFVSWNGKTLLDIMNLPAIGWTNIQYVVMATTTSTVLQFGFRDDSSFLGLDDISVVSPQPGIAGISLSGANLVINGTNGLSNATYIILISTNVALPKSQWIPVATNALGANGSFNLTLTNAVNHSDPKRFYILQFP